MRVAVAGGTGTAGRHVVQALTDRGHEPVVLARSHGVDLTTGSGLDRALQGAEAVIDVTNRTTLRQAPAAALFLAGTGRLLEAGARAGVRHHVVLSIVGVDRVGFGYYRAKLQQEQLALGGPVPGSVLRATQFHEFTPQLLARSPGPVAFLPRMRTQPVAAREVGAALAELATGQPVGRAPDLAGPREEFLPDLARRYLATRYPATRRRRRLVVGVRLPGETGRLLAGDGLLPAGPGPRGTQTFDQWLETVTP